MLSVDDEIVRNMLYEKTIFGAPGAPVLRTAKCEGDQTVRWALPEPDGTANDATILGFADVEQLSTCLFVSACNERNENFSNSSLLLECFLTGTPHLVGTRAKPCVQLR